MTATAPPIVRDRPLAQATRRFVEKVLDTLEVTERAYHHLNYALPLIADLVHRTRLAAGPGDRVLLIGGNTLLAEVLLRLGYRVDVWQFPHAYLTDDVKPLVSRRITPETVLKSAPPDDLQQVIILPLVLEALREPSESVFRMLRSAMLPEGRLIVATENQSRLGVRLAALAGKPIRPRAEAEAVSLSWPALPTIHQHHPQQIRKEACAAGFRVRKSEFAVPERPFLEMEPMNLADYGVRKLRHAIAHAVPPLRDVAVLELSPRVGDRLPLRTRTDPLSVSVFVSVEQAGDSLRETLRCLSSQTYPAELYQVIVLHDGTRDDVRRLIEEAAAEAKCEIWGMVMPAAEGPDTRNRAMAEARGDISAHTNDACSLPEDWLQAAVAWFDADTAAVSGPVFLKAGSVSRYLDVPGTRPDPGEKGVYPRNTFCISNVFYRTAVALAAGGFNRRFERSGHEPTLGWDTELAWRLQRQGWRARFREEVYEFRVFPPDAGRGSWLPRQLRRAAELPQLIRELPPEYAETSLMAGVFASKQTMYFDIALGAAALAITKRKWPFLLAALPWAAAISQRVDIWPPGRWPDSARTVTRITVRQVVWLAGLLSGSVKARRPVL